MDQVALFARGKVGLCYGNSVVATDTVVGSDPGTNPGLVEAFRHTSGNSIPLTFLVNRLSSEAISTFLL